MRLWHYELLSYLPKSQLIAQWRELNSIFKKQDKHILINYVYEYSKENLYYYTNLVIDEMDKRGYHIKSFNNFLYYFSNIDKEKVAKIKENPFPNHHNIRYLIQCYYNLMEKFDRGQQDFDEFKYVELCLFINNKLCKELDKEEELLN